MWGLPHLYWGKLGWGGGRIYTKSHFSTRYGLEVCITRVGKNVTKLSWPASCVIFALFKGIKAEGKNQAYQPISASPQNANRPISPMCVPFFITEKRNLLALLGRLLAVKLLRDTEVSWLVYGECRMGFPTCYDEWPMNNRTAIATKETAYRWSQDLLCSKYRPTM